CTHPNRALLNLLPTRRSSDLPGLTWKDWRALEPLAVAAGEQESTASPKHWRVIARKLRAEGRSVPDIALELGVALSTVGREVTKDRKSTRLNSSHQITSYPVF